MAGDISKFLDLQNWQQPAAWIQVVAYYYYNALCLRGPWSNGHGESLSPDLNGSHSEPPEALCHVHFPLEPAAGGQKFLGCHWNQWIVTVRTSLSLLTCEYIYIYYRLYIFIYIHIIIILHICTHSLVDLLGSLLLFFRGRSRLQRARAVRSSWTPCIMRWIGFPICWCHWAGD